MRAAVAAAVRERLGGQRGQGLVEYGLIVLCVAIAVVFALTAVGVRLQPIFNTVKNNLVT